MRSSLMILKCQFILLALLVSLISPPPVRPSQQELRRQSISPQNESAPSIWIKLKTGEVLTGQFVKVDLAAVEFTVRGILQAIPLDQVTAIFFVDPRNPAEIQLKSPVSEKVSAADPAEIIYEPGKNGVSNIRILQSDKPKYTDEAKQAGIQGIVKLEAVFRSDGKVKVIRVANGLPKGLTEKAIESAERIQFEPAKKDGKPVSIRSLLEYKYDADFSDTISKFDLIGRDPSFLNPELIGKRDINRLDRNFFSMEAEAQIGRELAVEIDRTARLIPDPVIVEYINRIAQNIARRSDAKFPFTVKMIYSSEINAFVLPGGFLYINSESLVASPNEAVFAGVLSHFLAHATARHSAELQTQTRGMKPEGMKLKDFPEDLEEEADALGAQYLWASGYDPFAWIIFSQDLASSKSQGKSKLSKEFRSHIGNQMWAKKMEAVISRMPDKSEYMANTSEFDQIKNRIMQIR